MKAYNDYSHQCRYCAYCVFTMHETWWCDELLQSLNNPKRPNKCKKFLFNEISADDFNKVYKPRRESPFVQDKLFEMPTDKQKEKSK